MKNLLLLFLSSIVISCASPSNSDTFVAETEGRYLYNSDETITVYFEEKELFLNWRGAKKIKPMPLGDAVFFVKEMNEKILFKTNPADKLFYMCLVPKDGSETFLYNYRKLSENEHVPSYYLSHGDAPKAIEGYLRLQKKDSLDPNLNEGAFNRMGYDYIKEKDYNKAELVFAVNVALFPESANTYDSMGDVLLRKGDTVKGVEFYQKAYDLDPNNKRAERIIKEFSKK